MNVKEHTRTDDSDPHGKRSIWVCLMIFFQICEGGYFSEQYIHALPYKAIEKDRPLDLLILVY